MYKINKQFEILTPSGFQHFDGINKINHDTAVKIKTINAGSLVCSLNHPLMQDNGEIILAKNISTSTKLRTVDNIFTEVESIELINSPDIYYDPINVASGNLYFSNEIVSHNCEFVSSDALLMESTTVSLLNSRSSKPLFVKNDFVFFDNLYAEATYLIGIDPATGSKRDFSVIEVFHFPSLVQVAEFRSNTMDSDKVYKKLKWFLGLLEKQNCETYFSVENNGVGEGIIALYQNDEEPFESSTFISEDGAKRYGMTTTPKKKMKVCLELKKLIEKNQMTVNSSILIKELKTFVRKGISYEAQQGSTDDCISACLIITRIINEMTQYDQDAFEKLYSYDKLDEYSEDSEEYDDNYEPDPIV